MLKKLLAQSLRKIFKLTPQAHIYSPPLAQDEQAIELTYLGTSGFIIKSQQSIVKFIYVCKSSIKMKKVLSYNQNYNSRN